MDWHGLCAMQWTGRKRHRPLNKGTSGDGRTCILVTERENEKNNMTMHIENDDQRGRL